MSNHVPSPWLLRNIHAGEADVAARRSRITVGRVTRRANGLWQATSQGVTLGREFLTRRITGRQIVTALAANGIDTTHHAEHHGCGGVIVLVVGTPRPHPDDDGGLFSPIAIGPGLADGSFSFDEMCVMSERDSALGEYTDDNHRYVTTLAELVDFCRHLTSEVAQ